MKIIEGEFLEGRLTKKDVENRMGLLSIIYNDYGLDVCIQFMQDLQGFSHRCLQIRGFTIGIADLIRSKKPRRSAKRERLKP